MRAHHIIAGSAAALLAGSSATAATIFQRFFQPETRDAYGRLNQEAANVSALTCNGYGESGRVYYIFQYLRRPGFRVIAPPYWSNAIGGRDWSSWAQAVQAASCARQANSGRYPDYWNQPVPIPRQGQVYQPYPQPVPNPQQFPQYPPQSMPAPTPAPTPPPVAPSCRFDRTTTWNSDVPNVGKSVWTLMPDGRASESGLGNASGSWRIAQGVLSIQYATGGYSGTYNLTLNATCTAGQGDVIQVTPSAARYLVTFLRSN